MRAKSEKRQGPGANHKAPPLNQTSLSKRPPITNDKDRRCIYKLRSRLSVLEDNTRAAA